MIFYRDILINGFSLSFSLLKRFGTIPVAEKAVRRNNTARK